VAVRVPLPEQRRFIERGADDHALLQGVGLEDRDDEAAGYRRLRKEAIAALRANVDRARDEYEGWAKRA
jgi:hypothetical protein